MTVYILGQGAWGKAVAALFLENSNDVLFWEKGQNITAGSVVFSAIPTQAFREVINSIGSPKNLIFINGAKGIERETHLLPYQITQEILPDCSYLTLIGPSFAEEVIKRMPTLVNLGYRDEKTAKIIKEILQTDYFRIKLTKSVRALELYGAFKNVYAIACGVAQGLGYGVNTRVKLMILALVELEKLQKALGFKMGEDAMPATLGDLILTCSSSESRNFRFGKLLAENAVDKSLEMVGATVEGYYTVESVPYFEKKAEISLPLAQFVYKITHKGKDHTIRKLFTDFVIKI